MSGIYIPGMEVPKDGMLEFAITDKGAVILTSRSIRVGDGEYFEPLVTPQELYRAVPVPDHGDLIDRDKLEKDIDKYIGGEESRSRFHHWVQVQDAVIPMDKGEEK